MPALAAVQEVVAFARRPEALTQHGAAHRARLTVIQGDVLDLSAVALAVAGSDVILSALGRRGGPSALVEGTRNILDAAQAHGTQRSLWVSSFGVGESLGQMGWFACNFIAGALPLSCQLTGNRLNDILCMN